MSKLICYPIKASNIPTGSSPEYPVVSACRPGIDNIWKDYTNNILFHKNMSFGVTFLYNGYSHLFTYYNHDILRDIHISVYNEKYSPEQRVLFNKYYNYNLMPLRELNIPMSLFTHIASYLKYKYNETADSIQLKLPRAN